VNGSDQLVCVVYALRFAGQCRVLFFMEQENLALTKTQANKLTGVV
jgi:hypothetical protein